MTDQEINKQLALVIGYLPEHVIYNTYVNQIMIYRPVNEYQVAHPGVHVSRWSVFDYKTWGTIGPIAERYDCFPSKYTHLGGKWQAFCAMDCYSETGIADTPQKAIAMAVIKGALK